MLTWYVTSPPSWAEPILKELGRPGGSANAICTRGRAAGEAWPGSRGGSPAGGTKHQHGQQQHAPACLPLVLPRRQLAIAAHQRLHHVQQRDRAAMRLCSGPVVAAAAVVVRFGPIRRLPRLQAALDVRHGAGLEQVEAHHALHVVTVVIDLRFFEGSKTPGAVPLGSLLRLAGGVPAVATGRGASPACRSAASRRCSY